MGNAVFSVVQSDILSVTGAMQLCAGQNSDCEVAVHDLNSIFC